MTVVMADSVAVTSWAFSGLPSPSAMRKGSTRRRLSSSEGGFSPEEYKCGYVMNFSCVETPGRTIPRDVRGHHSGCHCHEAQSRGRRTSNGGQNR